MSAPSDLGSVGPRVLVVDDEASQAQTLCHLLKIEGLEAFSVASGDQALAAVEQGGVSAVVSDLRMPGMTGLELFGRLREKRSELPFVLMTAFGTVETAVEAMRKGAHDFLTKPIDASELAIRLKKALRHHDLETENRGLRDAVARLRKDAAIVGSSQAMQLILERVAQVAPSQASVLLHGESGTGKELVARAIHLQSKRGLGPYLKVNCAAIPSELLESELFGHVKGAFTGAVGERQGRFELAHSGTILLDEIGDLPLALQPKLLRVLQEREFERVGSAESVAVDVRLIASTHRDLAAMVAEGTFREDLYYRLNVIPLTIPALRERREDVLPLAEHFLERFREESGRARITFSRPAADRLQAYSWPGNVRELENCIERAVVLARGTVIEEPDLMLGGSAPVQEDQALGGLLDELLDTRLTLDDAERWLITSALERCGGNVSRTARTLGLTRRALQYRLAKFQDEASDAAGPDALPEDSP